MAATMTGGCACGAVRYELRGEPFDTGWCHCTTCRRLSGAPACAFSTVRVEDFVLTRGEDRLGTFHSSNFGRRRFCRMCGTQLTIQLDHQPETIDFPIGSLDDPDAVVPAFHIFYASKVAWFETADDLPRHDRFRPGTRGLEGTEPPGG
jgi:hypothetical protein